MSDLENTLLKTKEDLLIKKKILDCNIKKYSLPGYINKKCIRGKDTFYLQFKDAYYRMTSVYLSKEKLALCEYAFNKKTFYESQLVDIESDLKLLENIQADEAAIAEMPIGTRIVDDAIGISAKYKMLFQIKADEVIGRYTITLYGKKENYEVPMIYVNEDCHHRILDYIKSAACIVDEAVEKMIEEVKIHTSDTFCESSRAQTKTGVKYSYEELDLIYLVSFYYKRKKYTLEYTPYFCKEENKKKLEITRMGFFVEKFLDRMKFDEEVSKYHERKQNVRIETEKS